MEDIQENPTGSTYPADTHIYYQSIQGNPYGTGDYLYSSLKITGSAMPEEEIFNVSELERVAVADKLNLSASVPEDGGSSSLQGLDLLGFLRMCGLDQDSGGNLQISFYQRGYTCPCFTSTLENLRSGGALIAYSRNGIPLVTDAESEGYLEKPGNEGGPLLLFTENEVKVRDLAEILVSRSGSPANPFYGLHIREPFLYMQPMTFTVNYVDMDQYPETDDHAKPFRTYSFTMKELENLLKETPGQVRGNYFGISGNEKTKNTLGLGGFSDYYEGLDLCWFLREKTGLQNGDGKAVFYGRDDDAYATVNSLDYFFANKKYQSYYLEIDNHTMITDVAPILAVSKNGCPLLPEHNHELEGNVDYNLFNHNAEALGFSSKIGIVKNVSGPFIAGLPNLDGVYGGYHCETSGDCVRVDCYVRKADYDQIETSFSFEDVPADSWFREYVEYLTEQGVVNGLSETVFDPSGQVTRAQFVKMIAAFAGADVSNASSGFTDVPEGYWAAPYIGWASENSLVTGTGEGRFRPEDPVSREQTAAIISRYIRENGLSVSKTLAASVFSDQPEISDYALDAVKDLTEYRILTGREDGRFDPHGLTSRAEAAAVIARFMRMCI